jgi:hypothetical protein
MACGRLERDNRLPGHGGRLRRLPNINHGSRQIVFGYAAHACDHDSPAIRFDFVQAAPDCPFVTSSRKGNAALQAGGGIEGSQNLTQLREEAGVSMIAD